MAGRIDDARERLVQKLADTMDPEGAAHMVARFEAEVVEHVARRDDFAKAAVGVLPGDVANAEQLADDAYLIADAMIRRRRIFPAVTDRPRPARRPADDEAES